MQASAERENSPASHYDSSPQAQLLTIEREFNVPVDQLFAAFTTSDALKAWWWPQGLHTDRVDYDFREGGHYFINMKGAEASQAGGGGMLGEFEEIIKNERIVMTDRFADKNGKAISAREAGMTGTWPETIFITFDFESTADGTSQFKLSQTGIPNEAQKDCIQGWSESFDKLEKYLETKRN